eukprot:gene1078-1222_t
MGFMGCCSMQKACANAGSTTGICDPFALLADGCQSDMPGMGGCASYKSMCNANGTLVAQCSNIRALPELPSTKTLNTLVYGMCTEMSMEACSACPVSATKPGSYMNCDLLETYSTLCQQMPGMSQCPAWKSLCAKGTAMVSSPLAENFCTPPVSKQTPMMRMFFHTGILDYVLFKDWVPRTNGQYAGYWFAIFFAAILFEVEKTLRSIFERKQEAVRTKNLDINGSDDSNTGTYVGTGYFKGTFPEFNWKIDIIRGFMHGFELTLSYLLMLVAMTFNVGLFFSVIAGTIVGNILVGRFRGYKPKVTCCD